MHDETLETDEIIDVRPSLLIADDDAVVRSTLGHQLIGEFNLVAAAQDADQAIELAEQHRPDAALIDVEMPNGGASKAVPEIATRAPDTCIVILSADESRDVMLELLNAGAMAYVRKGITGPEISKKLAEAMKAKGNHPGP